MDKMDSLYKKSQMIRYFRLHTFIDLILLFVLFCGTLSMQGQTSLAALESEMVLVEGGSMVMNHTHTASTVKLSDFFCSKYEVTQGLWQEVMGDNPSSFAYLYKLRYKFAGNTSIKEQKGEVNLFR